MDYSKEKFSISLQKQLLKKIDKIRNYPRWAGNRSGVIEEAIREFVEDFKPVACIFCGASEKDKVFVVKDKNGRGVCNCCYERLIRFGG
jgi:metal-responsive CopG/Arc/MetJ family transcriptional regulator